MIAAGAADEVRRANAAGASATARKALGFDELLTGDMEAMKRRTRNYARRQLTWMRKLAGVHVIDVTGRQAADVAAEIAALMAHGSGVNGYATTAATTTVTPHTIIRRGRAARARAITCAAEQVQPRHHDHHVVQVARPRSRRG